MSTTPATRQRILERDGYTCQHCGYEGEPGKMPGTVQVHHIEPRRDGGGNEETNLVTLCYGCHLIADRRRFLEAMRRWQIECGFANPVDVEASLKKTEKRKQAGELEHLQLDALRLQTLIQCNQERLRMIQARIDELKQAGFTNARPVSEVLGEVVVGNGLGRRT